MKFVKKPVVVEAITFDELVEYGRRSGATLHDGYPWSFSYNTVGKDAEGNEVPLSHPITHETNDCYLIPTREGTMRFERGDMLITGVAGEIYPCKPDIFAATYDPVEE